jgi:hypothetical protein
MKLFYNNDMYALLGIIIEKLTGKPYETILTEKILSPLEMNRTTVSRSKLEQDPMQNYIRGYLHKSNEGDDGEKGQTKLISPKLPFSRDLQAPGGIFASMHELANYGNCLLQKGTFKENLILPSEYLDILWKPRIKSPYGYGKDPYYCFGWVKEEDIFDHTFIHHAGGIGVSTSFLGLIPDLKLAVCCAENDDAGITGIVGMCALALMSGKDPSKTIEKYKILEIYEDLKGNYKSSLGLYDLEVFMENQSIYIKVESDDGTFKFPLIARNLNELDFKLALTVPYPVKAVRFHRDTDSGKVRFVTYDRYLYHKI